MPSSAHSAFVTGLRRHLISVSYIHIYIYNTISLFQSLKIILCEYLKIWAAVQNIVSQQ